MEPQYRIEELDFDFRPTVEVPSVWVALCGYEKRHGIRAREVTCCGPNHMPVVSFVGTTDQLRTALIEYCGGDTVSALEHMEGMTLLGR